MTVLFLLLLFGFMIAWLIQYHQDFVHRQVFAGATTVVADYRQKNIPWQEFVSVPNGKLHVAGTKPSGSYDTLIFYCHGNMGTIDWNWYPVIYNLNQVLPIARQNSTVVATWDYRQYGRSESTTFPTFEETIQDGFMVLNHLKQVYHPKQILLYGRSLGGAIVTRMWGSVRYPVFLETPFLGESFLHMMPPFVSQIFPDVFACKEFILEMVASYDSPILLLGEMDTLISCKKVQAVCPKAIVIPGRGHNDVSRTQQWKEEFIQWVLAHSR